MSWTARLLIGLALVLAGAAAATWGLARSDSAARLLGVTPSAKPAAAAAAQPAAGAALPASPVVANRLSDLDARVQRVESQNRQSQGSAGRADALLIAFAARRSTERGVALGYLEPLLVDRFGQSHPQAVATIVTAAREPVRLTELISGYQDLEPELLGPPPDEGLWTGIRRGFSSLISVRRSDRPSTRPQARYERALAHLMAGEVDSAIAETMRLPGAPRAREWVAQARRYVAARRALDQIESAALIGNAAVAQRMAPAATP